LSGDGLIPPLNAPPAGALVPGVQPGVSNAVVLAQYVIVFGTAGGVFVYTGTPAPGNQPIASLTNAATDPYDNPTQQGLTVYDLPAYLQLHVNTAFYDAPAVEMVTGAPSEDRHAVMYSIILNAGLVNETLQTDILGPASTSDTVQGLVQLVSAAADGSSEAGGVLYVVDNTTTVATPVAFWNSTAGFSVIAGSATAVKPGTGTSPANPPAAETWHAMSLKNSWANVSGFAVAQYRKVASPPNSVEITGAINAAAATAAAFYTLPAGYIPADKQAVCAMGANASVPAGLSPWIECDASGNLSVQNTGALGAWESFFHGFISLDA
jgi:hypothetical protein